MAGGRIIQLAARGLKTSCIWCKDDELGVDGNCIILIAYYFIQVWKYYIFIRLAVVICGCLKNLTFLWYEADKSKAIHQL
jgi:hypothetical protein